MNRLPEPWGRRFEALGRMTKARHLSLCLVGGCVRDLLLRRPPLDWDVVVEGPAAALVQEAAQSFSAKVTHHPAFLTYTLDFPDNTSLDVATARRETYPEPASLPVVEPASLVEDFARRDFTVNALAAHLTPERWGFLEDPFNGRADLRQKVVRVLHDKSFQDDPTRIYRAARYAGRYGFKVEPRTQRLILEAIRQKGPESLSPVRRRHELERILEEPDPRPALKLLWKWGAWMFWSPRWTWNNFVDKGLKAEREKPALTDGPAPVEGVAGASGLSSRALFRLLALCQSSAPDRAQDDLRVLEFPKAVTETVRQALLILEKLQAGQGDVVSPAKLSPAVQAFLKLSLKDPKRLSQWQASEPLLTGKDLQDLGYAPGPLYGKIFEALRAARLEGRLRTRAEEIGFVLERFLKS